MVIQNILKLNSHIIIVYYYYNENQELLTYVNGHGGVEMAY